MEEIRGLLAELGQRKIEGLKLYEPLPVQAQFHASRARIRLVRGSNRGGKTLAAAVEVARAVTGQDPHGKYPLTDGRVYCVGKNLDHVGQVMWRKLGRAGAYKIIRDKKTLKWRAYRPWSPEDARREDEARPAPALIPARLIKTIAWENKAKGIPKQVILHNGWELNFYSSEGKPPQGVDLDLWWFDEEIIDQDWYAEVVARVLDRKGSGLWSATPQAGTEKLYDLHEDAEKEAHKKHPRVAEFVSLLADNLHIDEAEKQTFAASLMDEDERRVRIEGEFAVSRLRVYPEYSPSLHHCDAFPIPLDWTRYAVIDPGRQVCAVLFGAFSPPEIGDYCYLYDELYIRNCDANQFGYRMALKAVGQSFEAFIIDHQGSRVTDTGSGFTVERQYSAALKRHGVRSRKTGNQFWWGISDVLAGVSAFRSWLLTRQDNTSKLRVLRGKCENFDWEMKHYRYKTAGETVTDKPEDRGRVHLMACGRYLALSGAKFVKLTGKAQPHGVIRALKEKQQRMQRRNGQDAGMVNLGPGKGGRW